MAPSPPTRRRRVALYCLLLFCMGLVLLRARGPRAGSEAARHVGTAACAECHAQEAQAWRGSHHDLAMAAAGPESVRGAFAGETFAWPGGAATFLRRDGAYWIRTEDERGTQQEHRVGFTFGVWPLQQYLLPLPDGRVQAFPVAWDARPAAQGGQRWFHADPGRVARAGERFHWTGSFYTWNHTCAECHSTHVQKGFDRAAGRYATRYAGEDVGCEACHGPGDAHVRWARAGGRAGDPDDGLAVRLRGARLEDWSFDPATGIARSAAAPRSAIEIQTCARCHARRAPLLDGVTPGAPLTETHLPALLEAGLYHADGQVLDEVFEWGSFLQSRMHAAGVTCTDCHEPHGARLRAEGNALCARCHLPARFDTPAHHHHVAGSAGAACTACHMPTKTFMVVHARHDHGFSVPRPDWTARYGVPNACSGCHQERDLAWVQEAFARWYPGLRRDELAVRALHGGRRGDPAARADLVALLGAATRPAILRGTAAQLLAEVPGSEPASLRAAAADPDPLVRLGVARGLAALPGEARLAVGAGLLADAARAVRVEAVRALAALRPHLQGAARDAYPRARADFVAAATTHADQVESLVGLATLLHDEGDLAEAARILEEARRRDPTRPEPLVNLADLRRAQGDEARSLELVRAAVGVAPQDAGAWHALGLALVRSARRDEGLQALRRAAGLAPADARLGLVHAIAVHDLGDPARALLLVEELRRAHPFDPGILQTLVAWLAAAGRARDALPHARTLAEVLPGNPGTQALLRDLERAARGR
ncbi:MAG: tetratricopeptide repeat protein [Planctomycetes bacterium]|nr:tetratricopeptide repeat protein [Planctomycetota bacterium]